MAASRKSLFLHQPTVYDVFFGGDTDDADCFTGRAAGGGSTAVNQRADIRRRALKIQTSGLTSGSPLGSRPTVLQPIRASTEKHSLLGRRSQNQGVIRPPGLRSSIERIPPVGRKSSAMKSMRVSGSVDSCIRSNVPSLRKKSVNKEEVQAEKQRSKASGQWRTSDFMAVDRALKAATIDMLTNSVSTRSEVSRWIGLLVELYPQAYVDVLQQQLGNGGDSIDSDRETGSSDDDHVKSVNRRGSKGSKRASLQVTEVDFDNDQVTVVLCDEDDRQRACSPPRKSAGPLMMDKAKAKQKDTNADLVFQKKLHALLTKPSTQIQQQQLNPRSASSQLEQFPLFTRCTSLPTFAGPGKRLIRDFSYNIV